MMPSLTARMSSKRSTAFGFFNLGQDRSTALNHPAGFFNVSSRAERKTTPTSPTPNSQTNSKSARSLPDNAGQRKLNVGNVHALAVRNLAAIDDNAISKVFATFFNLQTDLAVVDQQACARFKRLENLRVR